MTIKCATDFATLVYWDTLSKLPVNEVYPEYSVLELACLVIIANNSEIIGLGVTEDIGAEFEIPGVINWFNLELVTELEKTYLFEFHFRNMQFSESVLEYLKIRNK
jgi:hypothetical protein